MVGHAVSAGKVVVCEDEWPLSDRGFEVAPAAKTFAQNVGDYFTGGKPGKFLVYSHNRGLAEDKLAAAMEEKGHSWKVDLGVQLNAEGLKAKYDGIFLGGLAMDNKVLIEYVELGGCVYLCGGTGVGGAAGEAAAWKKFLMNFGLKFKPEYNKFGGGRASSIPTSSDHPILKGVDKLLYYDGNSIVDIDDNFEATKIIVTHPTGGSIAVYNGELEKPNVQVSAILYDGKVPRSESDEFVEISNFGGSSTDISGWKLYADDKGQTFFFPEGTVIKPGATFRVYTNEVHPESGGFSYRIGHAIWNNKEGDVAVLSNKDGAVVSKLAYGKFAVEGEGTDNGVMMIRQTA